MKTKTFFSLKNIKDCFNGKESQRGGGSHMNNL